DTLVRPYNLCMTGLFGHRRSRSASRAEVLSQEGSYDQQIRPVGADLSVGPNVVSKGRTH
ncbi:MAG: hypothetical protein V3S81_02190, partial [Anaerolineales bacterium]